MSHFANIACLSICAVLLLLGITINPALLSDENSFFSDFFGKDLIAFMGVILTISIGFVAQLFLSVARLRDIIGLEGVKEIRDELRSTARWLLIIFFVVILLIFAKSIIPTRPTYTATANSILSWLLLFYFLILKDVILSVFDFDVD